MLKLLLLFTLVPLLELWLLIEVGRSIGAWPTVFLVAFTGFAGVWLAKSQGLMVLRKMQAELAFGNLPGEEIFDGVCVLLGGAFLITPGLMTDLFGFFLLIPLTRGHIKRAAKKALMMAIEKGTVQFYRRW